MGGESEKEGFAFPRTKTFITAVGALDPLPPLLALTSSSRTGVPSSTRSSLVPSPGTLSHLILQHHLLLLELYGFLSPPLERAFLPSLSLSLSLSVLLVLFFFISLLRDVFTFFVSWSILLPPSHFSYLSLSNVPLFCLFILLAG